MNRAAGLSNGSSGLRGSEEGVDDWHEAGSIYDYA
jgi:hypothetical protein